MTTAFWKDAAVRALKTFAQAVLALMTTGSVGITHLDWLTVLNVAGAAALASVLTSVTSLSNVGTTGTGKHVDTGAVTIPGTTPSGDVPEPPVVDATPTV
jgi:hypothetical protein